MNKQALYVFGGALLASTALSTASHAVALIKGGTASVNHAVAPTTSISAFSVATQVFSATTTTANSQTLGNSTGSTANTTILIDYAPQLTSAFNIQLDISNASFSTTSPTVTHYASSATTTTSTGTLRLLASVVSCSVQPLPDKILISGCDPAGASFALTVSTFGSALTHADAIGLSGLIYTSAAALATAGQSITLSGVVRNSTNTVTFDNIAATPIITSKNAVESSVDSTAGNITVDNTATPAFTKVYATSAGVGTAGTTAILGTIHYSSTGAVGTDLSNVIGQSTLSSSTEVKISHSVLADPALLSITYNGVSKTVGQFVSGTVSFTLTQLSSNNSAITVSFDGTSAVNSASTTASATVTPTAIAGMVRAPAAFSGALATFTRGGLSIELNGVMPSAGVGSTTYKSVIRITNTSSFDGIATVTVKNDTTGASLGSFTTAALTSFVTSGQLATGGAIKGGGTLQLFASDIEAQVSAAATSGAAYKLVISGSFNGYAQNLMWNTTSGVFTDLSGFRNGALTLDP